MSKFTSLLLRWTFLHNTFELKGKLCGKPALLRQIWKAYVSLGTRQLHSEPCTVLILFVTLRVSLKNSEMKALGLLWLYPHTSQRDWNKTGREGCACWWSSLMSPFCPNTECFQHQNEMTKSGSPTDLFQWWKFTLTPGELIDRWFTL